MGLYWQARLQTAFKQIKTSDTKRDALLSRGEDGLWKLVVGMQSMGESVTSFIVMIMQGVLFHVMTVKVY